MNTLTVTSGDKTVSFNSVADVMRPSGSLSPFKQYATAKGFDITDKASRKLANKAYDLMKADFGRQVRQAMAVAATNDDYRGTKAKSKLDKDGNVVGFDFSLRVIPKAQKEKAVVVQSLNARIVAQDARIVAQDAEIARLKALGR